MVVAGQFRITIPIRFIVIKNLFAPLGAASTRSRVLPVLMAGLGLMPAGPATAQTFTDLYSFTALAGNGTNSDGAYPSAGLILSGNTLYGTTYAGGTNGSGTVFAVNTDGTGHTNLYSFAGYPSGGAGPYAGLILSGNTLYGTTSEGGSYNSGTVYAVSTNGTGFMLQSPKVLFC